MVYLLLQEVYQTLQLYHVIYYKLLEERPISVDSQKEASTFKEIKDTGKKRSYFHSYLTTHG